MTQEVERYLGSTSTFLIAQERGETTLTSSQIGERVKNLYAIELPERLLTVIDDGVGRGWLKAERAVAIVEDAIRDFETRGPTWNEGNGDGLSGSFRNGEGGVRTRDMLVRKVSGPEGQMYKAYLVNSDGAEKYLGCDGSLAAVKERARRFYIFNNVAATLKREAGLVKVSDQSVSNQRDARDASLEY